MSRNEEILAFVDSNLKLEGIYLSATEKRTIMDCLSGKSSFDDAIANAFAKHRKIVA